ncbi:MAG: HPr family phosphocarrier protein [Clostridia bacterium]|nr:HPr family phosphocarrier protein [Clostridia bacterium]
MKTFSYTIKDPLGIHARPAGLLVKAVKSTDSRVVLEKEGKSVNADRLLSVMGLGVRCGDTVTVTVSDGDEEASLAAIRTFFENNL